jgi:hypothetical protein
MEQSFKNIAKRFANTTSHLHIIVRFLLKVFFEKHPSINLYFHYRGILKIAEVESRFQDLTVDQVLIPLRPISSNFSGA